MAAAELAASQSLAAETTERAELRDVSVLSSSAILCSNLSKAIDLRCADNVQREKELINLLVCFSTCSCEHTYTISTVATYITHVSCIVPIRVSAV